MSLPRVVSRDEWLAARKELLAEEKAMTRARDVLSTKRRELPMVARSTRITSSKARMGRRACSTCSTAGGS